MENFFGFLFVVMIIASFWGGTKLACKWVKSIPGRIFLALLLIVVFIIAGTIAVIAGCSAVSGPVNFH